MVVRVVAPLVDEFKGLAPLAGGAVIGGRGVEDHSGGFAPGPFEAAGSGIPGSGLLAIEAIATARVLTREGRADDEGIASGAGFPAAPGIGPGVLAVAASGRRGQLSP